MAFFIIFYHSLSNSKDTREHSIIPFSKLVLKTTQINGSCLLL